MSGGAPWECWLLGGRTGWCRVGRYRSRQVAQNAVDRPYRRGAAYVVQAGTGERWDRRSGSWFKSDSGARGANQPGSAP